MRTNAFMRHSVIAGVLLCISLPGFANPRLQNGDFSAGLSAWTVEYGRVADGGGFALFDEDPSSLTSTLSQQFTIPSAASEISFDVLMASLGTYDPATWPDAFTACLYDNPVDLNPLISSPGYSDFFYTDHTGIVESVGSFDGTHVTLDVSAFRGFDAYLVFDLLASDDGMATTINLDNVNVSVVPVPGGVFLCLVGLGVTGLCGRFRKIH